MSEWRTCLIYNIDKGLGFSLAEAMDHGNFILAEGYFDKAEGFVLSKCLVDQTLMG